MTGITKEGIEVDRDFAAAPGAVFDAWTTAQHFARWFGGKDVEVPAEDLDYQPTDGGTWAATMVLPDGNSIRWVGEFIEVVAPERFVLTITDNPQSADRAVISVVLSSTGDGTRMRFTQETPGFAPEQREATIAGWQSFFDELSAGL